MAEPDKSDSSAPEPAPQSASTVSAASDAGGWDVEAGALAEVRGQTDAARAAHAAVLALCHAAGSFNLYDATNEAVTGFITELRTSLGTFLQTQGDLDLEIRAWDIIYKGDVVFLDRDRERSLPFRLYRDGVRRLVLHPGITWDEVIQLLGVLAIRAKGIRQQEDDVVTMLWNAGFKHLDVEAVEGLVAEDDERVAEPGDPTTGALTPKSAMQAMVFKAPFAFDYPVPPVGDRGMVVYRQVPPQYLERVRKQDSAEALPAESAQLVEELLALLHDELDPLAQDDLVPVLREVRSYLLGEGRVRELAQILQLIERRSPPEAREALFTAFADSEVVRRLLDLADHVRKDQIPEVRETALAIPGDHLSALLGFLSEREEGAGRDLALLILEKQVQSCPQRIVEKLLADVNTANVDLLKLLARVDLTVATNAAIELMASADPDVQLEALHVLDRAPYGPRLGKALVGTLRSGHEPVRRQALAMLVARRERRAWDVLLETFKTRATGKVSLTEASAVGEALAQLDPDRTRPLLKEWIRPGGLLGKLATVPPALRWSAVSGLCLLPGQETTELIQWLASKSSGDLQQHCQAALTRLAKH